ncbi:LytTR family DNA-binding domain-containing protein [Dokdonia sp.]|uniref:LytR/AlgR family response regulator transcription factor n=1 Tax=Dokdonia sp. TaxID=2024995 RepID=UPI003266691C
MMFDVILQYKRTLIFITLVMLLTIAFETAQQLYYINRYDITEGVTFLELLRGQSYRWLIWMGLGFFLFNYSREHKHEPNTSSYYVKLALCILGLVILNIFIISVLQMIHNEETFSVAVFYNEYFQFYIFQKAPMYTLGYIAITVVLHLYFTNEELQVQVHQLAEVKTINTSLYEKLSAYTDDKASVVTIKIGNKRRVIPVAHICWIEADDYCVKVHTNDGESLSMRSSLKALEEKLGVNFLRVHRKAIVNMDFVKELKLTNPPRICLFNQDEIHVSKSQLKNVRDFIGTLEIS